MREPLTLDEGMAFAKRWRDEKLAEQQARAERTDCPRCEGTGLITWFGHLGQGGRKGPCVKCQPLGAAQFALRHARDTWEPKQEKEHDRIY